MCIMLQFNGAKGTGFVYIKTGLTLSNMIFGGEQEHGKHAGTENIAGIVALGAAIEESVAMITSEGEKKDALVQETVEGLRTGIPGIEFNGENTERNLPVQFFFRTQHAADLLRLTEMGIIR